MSPTAEGPLGVYVHIPFCEAKCTYCHFAIDPRRPNPERQERYLQAVRVEMTGAEAGEADTLYFGGGTPSLMTVPRLRQLVEDVRARFRLPPEAEVTVEANPRDLDEGGYRELAGAGANRLSLGVQSFQDLGVYVPLVNGRVCAQAIQVLLAFYVVHPHTLVLKYSPNPFSMRGQKAI